MADLIKDDVSFIESRTDEIYNKAKIKSDDKGVILDLIFKGMSHCGSEKNNSKFHKTNQR